VALTAVPMVVLTAARAAALKDRQTAGRPEPPGPRTAVLMAVLTAALMVVRTAAPDLRT